MPRMNTSTSSTTITSSNAIVSALAMLAKKARKQRAEQHHAEVTSAVMRIASPPARCRSG